MLTSSGYLKVKKKLLYFDVNIIIVEKRNKKEEFESTISDIKVTHTRAYYLILLQEIVWSTASNMRFTFSGSRIEL